MKGEVESFRSWWKGVQSENKFMNYKTKSLLATQRLTNFSSLLSCIFMHKYVCTYLPSLKNGLNLQYYLVKHHN